MLSYEEVIASARKLEDGRIETLNPFSPYNPDGSPNYQILPTLEEVDKGPYPAHVRASRSEFDKATTTEAKAIAYVVDNPVATIEQIAKAIGCHRGTLTRKRCPRLHELREGLKCSPPPPYGEKDSDGRIESFSEPSEIDVTD